MLVSVVIPSLNEADRIERCIASARRGYPESEVEIVVVDGGSSDGTAELVAPAEHVLHAEHGRAVQMNAGAEAAGGQAFAFCHADTQLPGGWREVVLSALATPGVSGGCFRVRFEPARGVLRILNRLPFPRNWRFVFGDQVQFMARDTFEAIGGFPEIPLMEDVEMARSLARHGRIVRVGSTVVTSSRRFLDHGPLRQLLVDIACWIRYLLFGACAEELSRVYQQSERGAR